MYTFSKEFKNFLPSLLIIVLALLGTIGLSILLGLHFWNLFLRDPNNVDWVERTYTREGWLIVIAFAGLLFMFVMVLVSSRWRASRLFVSYHAGDFELARRMGDSLEGQGFVVYIEPPGPVNHDVILARLRVLVDACDAVLVIPGRERSFVDAEVFAVSVAKKPVVVIAASADDTLPDTVLCGYPTFLLDDLLRAGFKPLSAFLRFQFMHWLDSLSTLGEAIRVIWAVHVGIGVLLGISLIVAGWISFRWFLFISAPIDSIQYPILLLSFAIITIYRLYARLKAASITRQVIITGNVTTASLQRLLPDRLSHIFKYMSPEPLGLRHAPLGTPEASVPSNQ
ncbi:MAG: hypothetical protein WAN65_17930 [Candidatus Sulfotelmatobacter sp.]